jgi:saccharopine dehydrogenase (NADP+, L-glutamate forming)
MPPKYKVLVLGAGFVTRPLVHYLSQHNIHVILVDIILSNAQNLIKGATNAEARKADITNEDDLKKIDAWTSDVDAVVSMLPYVYHPSCAKIAIKHKKPFFTTSYVSDAMRELEEDAKKASVILLNECGLDPGSDHMSAMRMIEHIRRNGGNIVSFTSFCGGLPAPHCNNNPLGYKFSWAPRGVLLACKNDARFLRDGKEVFIPAKELFERFEIDSIEGLGEFEVYPNRNSLQYLHIYNIPEAKTLIRGTYRYKGHIIRHHTIARLQLHCFIVHGAFLESKKVSQGHFRYSMQP